MTVTGKALTEALYGAAPEYSYLNGCSTGGRQGLMEAQRYPLDYNAILAGAPAINWTNLMMQSFWGSMVMNAASNPVASCKLAAATSAALTACDGIDGVKDGVIENPRALHVRSQDAHRHAGGRVRRGVTQADADIIRKLWDGPASPRTAGRCGTDRWRGTDLSALAATRGTPLQPQALWFRGGLAVVLHHAGSAVRLDDHHARGVRGALGSFAMSSTAS